MQCTPAALPLLDGLIEELEASGRSRPREALAELSRYLFLCAAYPAERLSPGGAVDAA